MQWNLYAHDKETEDKLFVSLWYVYADFLLDI